MTRNAYLVGAAALAVSLFIGSAEAQSFKCRNARLPTEVAICFNSALSALDQRIAHDYSMILNNPDIDEKQVETDQRAWLRSRNRCGSDVQCIAISSTRRIKELNSY